MMKMISWNVNGIRAVAKKGLFDILDTLDADVYCFQETKAEVNQVNDLLQNMFGYELYANSADRKGYSGTAVITRIPALGVVYDMGHEQHDKEGRVITLEFEDFYLVNVYTPNSGAELARLSYRMDWDEKFLAYVKSLETKKPVVITGDLNVANTEIDLANPKSNYNKTAGYMQEEIDGMNRLLSNGFVDTFRHFYPDKRGAYTWWSYRAAAKSRNIGWRIDYFLCSKSIIDRIQEPSIYPEVSLSDHCPVSLTIL